MFTGYAAVLVNIAYTALSMPLALYYLRKQEFGLWALALQISGYFMLVDLGIWKVLNRLIVSHKDDVYAGSYGGLLLTGALVFVVQILVIAAVGVALSFCASALFSIPQEL